MKHVKRHIPKIETLSKESQELYDVLNNEPDLPCVLVATSYLDDALASLLKCYFIESSVVPPLLDGSRGLLSTFFSRYTLAYCLGLIPKALYQNLEKVGDIRNEFAHSRQLKTFDDPRIIELTKLLIFPFPTESVDTSSNPAPRPGFLHIVEHDPRSRFVLTVVLMSNALVIQGLKTKHRERNMGWGWAKAEQRKAT